MDEILQALAKALPAGSGALLLLTVGLAKAYRDVQKEAREDRIRMEADHRAQLALKDETINRQAQEYREIAKDAYRLMRDCETLSEQLEKEREGRSRARRI